MPIRVPRFFGAAAAAVAISVAGLALHTAREFGVAALPDPESGFLHVAVIEVVLVALAWALPAYRGRLLFGLAAMGAILLVGGAILTALPVPVLPFTPEASASHYASHVALGVAQLPLLVLPFLAAREAPAARRAAGRD